MLYCFKNYFPIKITSRLVFKTNALSCHDIYLNLILRKVNISYCYCCLIKDHILGYFLTYLFPMNPFFTPWKHQKAVRFSGGRERCVEDDSERFLGTRGWVPLLVVQYENSVGHGSEDITYLYLLFSID